MSGGAVLIYLLYCTVHVQYPTYLSHLAFSLVSLEGMTTVHILTSKRRERERERESNSQQEEDWDGISRLTNGVLAQKKNKKNLWLFLIRTRRVWTG